MRECKYYFTNQIQNWTRMARTTKQRDEPEMGRGDLVEDGEVYAGEVPERGGRLRLPRRRGHGRRRTAAPPRRKRDHRAAATTAADSSGIGAVPDGRGEVPERRHRRRGRHARRLCGLD